MENMYEQMYLTLFYAMAQAVEEIDSADRHHLREILLEGFHKAEEIRSKMENH